MADVTLTNVNKQYPNGFVAIENLDLSIEDGEFLVLVGPSGCGKSTLLRMIAGLEEITGGEVQINGKRVNEVAPKNRDIAMVFQNYALYPHMTVAQNIGFALKLGKVKKAEIKARVEAAAKILELEPLLDRNGSVGFAARVARHVKRQLRTGLDAAACLRAALRHVTLEVERSQRACR